MALIIPALCIAGITRPIVQDIVNPIAVDLFKSGETWTTPTDIPADEAAALLAFYEATGGDNWTDNTGWGTSATANDWYGVTVSGGHVTAIDTETIGLTGSDLATTDSATMATLLDMGLFTYQIGAGRTYETFALLTAGVTLQPGDIISGGGGTFAETWTVPVNGTAALPLILRDATIDGEDTRNTGIVISSKDYIHLLDITAIDCLVSCVYIDGTSGTAGADSIKTTNLTVSGAGNQGIQHKDTAVAYHYNLTGSDCVDEAVSGHEDAQIFITTATLSANTQAGINTVANSHVNASGLTITGGTYSIYGTGAGGEYDISDSEFESLVFLTYGVVATLTNCTFTGGIEVVNAEAVTVNGGSIAAEGILLTSTTIEPVIVPNVQISDAAFTGSKAFLLSATGDPATLTLTGCTVTTTGGTDTGVIVNGHIVLDRCVLSNSGSDMVIDTDATGTQTLTARFCIFKSIGAAKFHIAGRGALQATVNNCVFHDADGKAIYGTGAGTSITGYNNVFYGMAEAVRQASSATLTMDHCDFYGCTADTVGTVTLTNKLTADPKFTDAGSGDYTLAADSTLGNAGVDTPYSGVVYDMANEAVTDASGNVLGNMPVGAYLK